MDYRHEYKFLVTDEQFATLEFRLRPLLKQDVHQSGQAYRIRSVYFDDFFSSCLHENEDGIDNRSKYRIRIYNEDTSVIKLEKKMKFRGMTQKVSTKISKENCLLYLAGQTPELCGTSSEAEKELYVQIKGNGMHPVCIVQYERKAFVEFCGNVRITFDRNISACENSRDFFEKNISLVPLLPSGQHILEIKYDEFLPQYISEILEIGTLQRTSFSKYYYARKGIER